MFPRNILPIALCAFFIIACADNSCSASGTNDTQPGVTTAAEAIQHTNLPGQNNDAMRTISIRVDHAFTTYDRAKILRAVSEWNHGLNGYMHLDLSAERHDPVNPPPGERADGGPNVAEPAPALRRGGRSSFLPHSLKPFFQGSK